MIRDGGVDAMMVPGQNQGENDGAYVTRRQSEGIGNLIPMTYLKTRVIWSFQWDITYLKRQS